MTQKGRPKGSKNHQSKITSLAAKYDLLPLDYMMQILNDEEQEQGARMDAAKSAAAYIHPRLTAATVEQKPYEGDPDAISNEYLASIIARAGSSNADDEAQGKGKPH